MQRTLASSLVPILMSLALAAHADAPRVRYFDSATGCAIPGQAIREEVTSQGIIASAPGHRPMSLRVAEDAAAERIDVYLAPLTLPAEVDPARIAAVLRADATLIQGFVVDQENGQPLANADVVADGSHSARTDARGFFRMWIESKKASAEGTLRFTAAGYASVTREHVELWPGGDWTYRIRMQKGDGAVIVDERELRTRGHGGDADEIVVSPAVRRVEPATTAIDLTISIPSTIRIGMSGGVVEYRTLEDYCKFVLPAEWIPSWALLAGGLGINSLRAGAVAIRTYAIGYVQQPYSSSYDICGTTSCQVYDPSKENSYATTAVKDTAGVVMVNAAGAITYKSTEYSAENNAKNCYDLVGGARQYKTCTCPDGSTGDAPNCLTDAVCLTETRNGHGKGMCQWGSSRWASGLYTSGANKNTPHPHGTKTWQEILLHYYPALSLAQGSALAVGDRVKTSRAGVGVRECSGGGIADGGNCPSAAPDRGDAALGRIIEGPQWVTAGGSGGFTWWRVRWDSDQATGWTTENYLRRVIGAESQTRFSGTITDARNGAAIAGATVSWGVRTTTSAANGTYAFETVPCTTETLTVAKSGFSGFAQSYAPSCDATNVKDVALAPAVPRRRAAGH